MAGRREHVFEVLRDGARLGDAEVAVLQRGHFRRQGLRPVGVSAILEVDERHLAHVEPESLLVERNP